MLFFGTLFSCCRLFQNRTASFRAMIIRSQCAFRWLACVRRIRVLLTQKAPSETEVGTRRVGKRSVQIRSANAPKFGAPDQPAHSEAEIFPSKAASVCYPVPASFYGAVHRGFPERREFGAQPPSRNAPPSRPGSIAKARRHSVCGGAGPLPETGRRCAHSLLVPHDWNKISAGRAEGAPALHRHRCQNNGCAGSVFHGSRSVDMATA